MEKTSDKMEAEFDKMEKKADTMVEKESNEENETEQIKTLLPFITITSEENEMKSQERDSYAHARAIVLNIRGEIFIADHSILTQIPSSRLALLVQDENLSERMNTEGELFFNKDPIMFGYIMNLYKDHVLHIPKDKCVITIQEDLQFWGIDESLISPCCRKQYFDSLNLLCKSEEVKKQLEGLKDDIESDMTNSPRRRMLAIFLHKRNSSRAAKIWSYVFPLMLFISVGLIFCTTHPNFRLPLPETNNLNKFSSFSRNKQVAFVLNTKTYMSVTILELVCCVFFTVELVLRVIAYSTNFHRLLSVSTLFHLLYLIPAWISILMRFINTEYWIGDYTPHFKLAIHILCILRVFHLQRLALQCRELMILWLAIKTSIKEITLMLVLVLTVCVASASLMFVTNLFIDSSIETMFSGLWWTIITITTVGYGDQYPRSWLGYAVASVCALTGVIITGMSIPLITKRFHDYYQTQLPEMVDCKDNVKNNEKLLSSLKLD